MRTIIAGSRSFDNYYRLLDIIKILPWEITEVISGTARGADRLGEEFAERFKIPLKRFSADWNTHGRSAGYKRNVQMAEQADALLAIWDNRSPGTRHMINIAKEKKLAIYIYFFETKSFTYFPSRKGFIQ